VFQCCINPGLGAACWRAELWYDRICLQKNKLLGLKVFVKIRGNRGKEIAILIICV